MVVRTVREQTMTPEDLQAAWPCVHLQIFTDDPRRFRHLEGRVNREDCAGMPPRSIEVGTIGHRLYGSTDRSDSAYFTFSRGSHYNKAKVADFGPLVAEFGGNRPPLLRDLWSRGSRLINRETYHKGTPIAVLIWVGKICGPGSPPIREQLTRRLAAIRDAWTASPSNEWRREIVELECRVAKVPSRRLKVFERGVNAAETCGAPPKHLNALGSWSSPLEERDGPGHMVVIRLAYAEHPWFRYDRASVPDCPFTDFDGSLAAIELAANC